MTNTNPIALKASTIEVWIIIIHQSKFVPFEGKRVKRKVSSRSLNQIGKGSISSPKIKTDITMFFFSLPAVIKNAKKAPKIVAIPAMTGNSEIDEGVHSQKYVFTYVAVPLVIPILSP